MDSFLMMSVLVSAFDLSPVIFAQSAIKPDGECKTGWVQLHRGCYRFLDDDLSWTDAERSCEGMAFGGHLVTIQSMAEKDALTGYLLKSVGDPKELWWAGISKNETSWKTLGGEIMNEQLTPWKYAKHKTRPGILCGALNSDLRVIATKCSRSNSFICEYHYVQVVTTLGPTVGETTSYHDLTSIPERASTYIRTTKQQKSLTKTWEAVNNATDQGDYQEEYREGKIGKLREHRNIEGIADTSVIFDTRKEATRNVTTSNSTSNVSQVANEQFAQSSIGDRQDVVPPHIKEPSGSDVFIVKQLSGDPFTFTCVASGSPTPTYHWYNNDVRLLPVGDLKRAFMNGTLYFPHFRVDMEGAYQCRATNAHGTSVSVGKTFRLQKTPASDTKAANDKVMYKEEGESFSISAGVIPVTLPQYNRQWYRAGYRGKDQQMIIFNKRIGMDTQGTLHFAYLTTEDSGIYKFGLAGGNAIILYNKGNLHVRSKQSFGSLVNKRSIEPTTPTELYVSSNVSATLGTRVVLDCFFGGVPIPEIQWQNVSNHVIGYSDVQYDVISEGRQLAIKAVREEDEGEFKCTLKNSEVFKAIKVNVTSPPRRVPNRGLRPMTLPTHDNVSLSCHTHVAPREATGTIRWWRNGEPLTQANVPDPARYRFNPDMTRLNITHLDKDKDMACFQCDVTNSEGSLFMDGYLRVIDSIEISRRPDNITTISPWATIDLSVLATGDSCCDINYLWRHNGTEMRRGELGEPYVYDEYANTLYLNASSVTKDAVYKAMGTYTVRVSNKHQLIKLVTFTVAMQAATPAPVTSSPVETAQDGGLWWWWLVVVCAGLLMAAVVVVYVIKKTKPFQKDTYELEKKEIKHNLNPEEDLMNKSFQEM